MAGKSGAPGSRALDTFPSIAVEGQGEWGGVYEWTCTEEGYLDAELTSSEIQSQQRQSRSFTWRDAAELADEPLHLVRDLQFRLDFLIPLVTRNVDFLQLTEPRYLERLTWQRDSHESSRLVFGRVRPSVIGPSLHNMILCVGQSKVSSLLRLSSKALTPG